MTTSHQLTAPHRGLLTAGAQVPVLIMCVVGAGLMVTSGVIHLHLWNEYYRHITTGHMNVLFMIQAIAAFVIAAGVLVMRNALAALAGAALMGGTAIGYLIARYHSGGLFGFYLGPHFSSSDATAALTVEIIATVVLLATALVALRGPRADARRPI